MQKIIKLSVLAASAAVWVAPAFAQVTAPAAPLAERSENGLSVRIKSARWQRTDVPQPPRDWSEEEREHLFVLEFDALKNGAALPAEKTLKDMENLRVVAINHDGDRFPAGKLTQPLPDFYRTWNNLDPRWPLEFEFIVRDPQAPADADGRFSDAVMWNNVPLPTEKDKIVDIKREIKTAHGATVMLDQMKWQSATNVINRNLLLITLRWQPPAALLDMSAEFNIDPSREIDFNRRVADDTGKALRPQLNKSSWLRTSDSGVFTLICEEPAPNAKNVTVAVNFKGYAPGLRQEKWFQRLRVKLPPTAVKMPPVASTAPTLASAETGGARVVLDGMVAPSQRNLMARLYLENAATPVDGATRYWMLRRILLRDPQGQPLADRPDPELQKTDIFWRYGSRPLPDGASGYAVRGMAPMPRPAFPAKFGLEAQIEQRVVREFKAEFKDLPLPTVGQMLNIDREIVLDKIGRLSVRAIVNFDAEKSPTPEFASMMARRALKPPAGLAVLLLMTPDDQTPPGSDQFYIGSRLMHDMSLGDAGTQDDTGTALWRTTAWAQSSLDEITRKFPTGPNAFKTIYLLPPAPQSKTFSLRCEGLWTVAQQQQKVMLRDLQLPTP